MDVFMSLVSGQKLSPGWAWDDWGMQIPRGF